MNPPDSPPANAASISNNESDEHPDPRTGLTSFIHGPHFDEGRREDVARQNRLRMGGLRALHEQFASGGSLSPDLWFAAFQSAAAGHGVPLVDIAVLGLRHGEDGFITSDWMQPLVPGGEAQPFLDEEQGVVYKLFPPGPQGNIGQKLFARNGPASWDIRRMPGRLDETMEKLAVIHEAGGLPTEIIGLTLEAALLVKQPQAMPLPPSMEARAEAVAHMNGVSINADGFQDVRVFCHEDKSWLLGDLHAKNIMQDSAGVKRVMDALTAEVSSNLIADEPEFQRAVSGARQKVNGKTADLQQDFLL